MFSSTDNEAQVVNEVRGIFRAYLPEADAWKMPSFFGVVAIVLGGAVWTVLNEARNNVDARVNPVTATGADLDRIAATPPLNIVRLDATVAEGLLRGQDITASLVQQGQVFTTADGTTYAATETVTVVAGRAVFAVTSNETGDNVNAIVDQPMTSTDVDGQFFSEGVFGGNGIECDDNLRRRIFSEHSRTAFLGSPCSYQEAMAGITGVSRSWTILDGGIPKVLFLTEDLTPDGVPPATMVQAVRSSFQGECMTSIFYCANFEGARSLTLSPEICWETAPEDLDAILDAIKVWLRANYDLGEGVTVAELQAFLGQSFPQYGPKVLCTENFEGECDAVYNMVDFAGAC